MTADMFVYPADGEGYGRQGYLENLRIFCSTMKGAKFRIRELNQVAPNVMMLRASLSHPSFKTPDNRIVYSEAINVKRAIDTYKIHRYVRSKFLSVITPRPLNSFFPLTQCYVF